jgi:HK97 family phage prohead protease
MAKYTADEINTMAKNGDALPDGSYPIKDQEDLENAIHAVGRSGDSHNEVRVHIIKRAKALGLSHLIPPDWAANGALELHPTMPTHGMNSWQPPRDNLIRAVMRADAIQSDGHTMFGHFAVFNSPTEIHDAYEGDFIEQISPGAFARTLRQRGNQVKVLFNHGQDPTIGNKPLGTIASIGEDTRGVSYEVDLFDSSYVNDLLPALRASALGASFRFSVNSETWNDNPKRSDANPDGLPERTIHELNLYEFGPVTFPAYADATAGVRSMTSDFASRLLNDGLFAARLTERAGLEVVESMIHRAQPTATPTQTSEATAAADGEAERRADFEARQQWLRAHVLS